MSDSSWPPRTWLDVEAYDDDEIVAGFRDYRPDDPEPGENHSHGYRWGWTNRRKDSTGIDDGFEGVRRELIRNSPWLLVHTVH
jgi:hypothetical protein